MGALATEQLAEYWALSAVKAKVDAELGAAKARLLETMEAGQKEPVRINGVPCGFVMATAARNHVSVFDSETFRAWQRDMGHIVRRYAIDWESVEADGPVYDEVLAFVAEHFPHYVERFDAVMVPPYDERFVAGPGGCVLFEGEVVPGCEWVERVGGVKATDVRANRRPDPQKLMMAVGGSLRDVLSGAAFAIEGEVDE